LYLIFLHGIKNEKNQNSDGLFTNFTRIDPRHQFLLFQWRINPNIMQQTRHNIRQNISTVHRHTNSCV